MGFIHALYDLGKHEIEGRANGPFADIECLIQMPLDLIPSKEVDEKGKKPSRLPGMVIRVWLDVADPQADVLDIRGIWDIDLAEFWGGTEDDAVKKRRYLYREPAGSNAPWRFSPLYKLGTGVPKKEEGVKALAGAKGAWREDKKSRFYKLRKSTLYAFEERGVFSEGSTDRVMSALEERVDQIADYWTEKERSYLLLFSPCGTEGFLYPAEVKSFLKHFRERFDELLWKDNSDACAWPGCTSGLRASIGLDKAFKFSTFDKKSFLPGLEETENAQRKVFALCEDCFRVFSEGRSVLDSRFLDSRTLQKIHIYVLPELLLGTARLGALSKQTRDFLREGLKNEPALADYVLSQADSMVFHFIFWEKNQKQERLLLMVEDVAPSYLRQLEELWRCSVKTVRPLGIRIVDPGSGAPSLLMQAVQALWGTLGALGGKGEDTAALRDWLVGLIGKLLCGQRVDVPSVKGVIVSRLRGLCADSDWVRKKCVPFMSRAECIIDFLYRVNGGLKG